MTRLERHVAAFNEAVGSGEWTGFSERFSTDARMGFSFGSFHGRAAIARAYAEQPPTDTLSIVDRESAGDVDVVRVRWTAGGAGTMRLRWAGDLVADLEISFD